MVVSIGDDNDKGLLIWETHSPRIISANLMKKSSINGVIFLAQSDEIISFITYGTKRHLKLLSDINVMKTFGYAIVTKLPYKSTHAGWKHSWHVLVPKPKADKEKAPEGAFLLSAKLLTLLRS